MGQYLEKDESYMKIEKNILEKEKNIILYKDIKVNFPMGDDIKYDDFYRVSQFKQPYKVYKILILNDKRSGYITGLQFTYSTISDNPQFIQGNFMGSNDPLFQRKEYTLQNNEYIVELKGRNGLILDNFGFITSLHNYYHSGGNGGGDYHKKAPQGYHFNNFGAYFSVGWGTISAFSADIQLINPITENNNNNNNNKSQQILCMFLQKPIIRSVIGYLKIKEIAILFLVNKNISKYRYDDYVIGQLGLRCIFSCDQNLMNYMNQLQKNSMNSDLKQQRYQSYQLTCKNLISNPNGEQGFQDLQIKGDIKRENKNNLNYFLLSPMWQGCSFTFNYNIQNNMSTDERQQMNLGKLAFVAGAQIAQSGYGTKAIMSLTIIYMDETNITTKKEFNHLTRDLLSYNIVFKQDMGLDNLPVRAVFTINIQDHSSWPSKLRQLSFRKFPFEEEQEINLLKQLSSQQKYDIVQPSQI